jgi:hypothetical protein
MSGDTAFDDVGSKLIDAYLIDVEKALIDAGAPRPDRLQVLQDLETQIAEMLAPGPMPASEEAVRAVLDKLEPPSHFAVTYTNGGKQHDATAPISPAAPRTFRLPRTRWPNVAAVSTVLLVFGCLSAILAGSSPANDEWMVLAVFGCLVGLTLTPIALWMAYRQLRSDPAKTGRGLVIKSAIVYATIAPVLFVLWTAAATNGAFLILVGVAAFLFAEYVLLRRLWKYLCDAFPTPPSATTNPAIPDAPPSAHPATPMPAV